MPFKFSPMKEHEHDLGFDSAGAVYCLHDGCDFYVEGDDLLELVADGLAYRALQESDIHTPDCDDETQTL